MQSTETFLTLKRRVAVMRAEETVKQQEMSTRLSRVRSMRNRKPRRTQLVEVLNRSVRKLIATNKEKHETDLELANLMDDREEELTLKDMQVSYYSKWYHAKSDQNMFLINKKLSQHQQQILSTSQRIEQEHRVANEIINFLRKSVQDLNDQLDWWKLKYETDLEEKHGDWRETQHWNKLTLEETNNKQIEQTGAVDQSGNTNNRITIEQTGAVDQSGNTNNRITIEQTGAVDQSGNTNNRITIEQTGAVDQSGNTNNRITIEQTGAVDQSGNKIITKKE
ncbi:hypothetical protein WDU94_004481 [Cyamophila willieti]